MKKNMRVYGSGRDRFGQSYNPKMWSTAIAGVCSLLLIGTASADPEPRSTNSRNEESVPYKAAVLMEPETGTILYEKDAHEPWPPASMVKMMTTMVVLEQINDGQLSLDDTVTTSRWASKMGGSQVYLKEGETFSVEDLLRAVMIHSANDASVALAEHVAGSPEAFVDLMNDKARQLGLEHTQFHSVHGLPPGRGQEDDLMSAYDLAVVGRKLLKFPLAAEWAAISTAPFRNGSFILTNPNRLLQQFRGADGIKTGYHRGAGFCVTASAKRGDLRLIAVVLGAQERRQCFLSAVRLLNRGFAGYRMIVPIKKGQTLDQRAVVRDGVLEQVGLVADGELRSLVPRMDVDNVQIEVRLGGPVHAPVAAGQVVGEVVVTLDGKHLGSVGAVSARDIARLRLWERWWPF